MLTKFILCCQIYHNALKESSDKFKKQQEMCQVTPYNPANAKSPAPVGAQIKRVIDLLREVNRSKLYF